MGVTDDRNDPGLREIGPDGQQKTYLVLSDEELAKGFVRPVRRSYIHVGRPGPAHPLLDLTPEQAETYNGAGYVKYEKYDEGEDLSGRFWKQADLDRINHGCGGVTTMGLALAETYARDPHFYGGTYCAICHTHFPVGEKGEFLWDGTDQRVGS